MALAAVGAELAVVNIIRGVAAAAGRWHVVCVRGRAAMTVATGEPGVLPFEGEVRTDIVVEHGGGPAVARVTAFARAAEGAFMNVVFRVAARAFSAGIEKAVALVATAAGNRCVQASQREARQVVIEADGGEPGGLRMAVRALDLHLAAMAIVHGMTARACLGNIFCVLRFVTCGAVERLVGFDQAEARFGMIEQAVRPDRRLVTGPAV